MHAYLSDHANGAATAHAAADVTAASAASAHAAPSPGAGTGSSGRGDIGRIEGKILKKKPLRV